MFGDQAAGTATDSCLGRDSVAGDASEQRSRGDVSLLPAVSARWQAVSLPIRHGEAEKMGIYIGSLDGKPGTPATRIVQTQFKAEYDAGSGRLLYVQGAGMLMAQRLELDPPRLTGDPATVAEGVRNTSSNGYAEFSVSRNGTLFYGQGSAGEKVRFGWRDRAGKLLETIGQPVEARFSFSLSPDGSRVAYYAGPGLGQTDIWVLELAGGRSTHELPSATPYGRDGRPTGSNSITPTQAESTGKRRMGLARRSC